MDELEARHRAHNEEQELLVGMIRVGVPDYPFSAYREGVANALIHRTTPGLAPYMSSGTTTGCRSPVPAASRRACG